MHNKSSTSSEPEAAAEKRKIPVKVNIYISQYIWEFEKVPVNEKSESKFFLIRLLVLYTQRHNSSQNDEFYTEKL